MTHLPQVAAFADRHFLVKKEIDKKGKATKLIDLNQGSADLAYFPETGTVLIPMMLDNTLAAYRLSKPAAKTK